MQNKKFDLCALVKEQILRQMKQMNFSENNKLPSEKQLAEKLQVSRSTIRTVLATLEDEGKIFRKHGSGTYANLHAFEIKTTLYPQVYYTDLIKLSGYSPSIEILSVEIKRSENIAVRLGLKASEKLIEVQKIYYANEKMCIYCIDYMSSKLLNSELIERLKIESISIFQFLSQYTDLIFAWDMVMLEATDSKRISVLQKYLDDSDHSPKPFLCIDSMNYDIKNQPMLFSKSYIDTDHIKYYLVRGNFETEKQ